MSTSNLKTHVQIIDSIDGVVEKAKKSGDLMLFDSTVRAVEEGNIKYELRLCPALAQKPRVETPSIAPESPQKIVDTIIKKDPFLPPFDDLYVGELEDAKADQRYVVLLNKYAVVRGHFLVVSKEYQSQSSPLSPSDLLQTYLLLLTTHALSSESKRQPYFAFFNCGTKSGASQPHKHIQFIPLAGGEDGGGPPIERVARQAVIQNDDRPFLLPDVPYTVFVRRLDLSSYLNDSSNLSSLPEGQAKLEDLRSILVEAFHSLLDEMYNLLRIRAALNSSETILEDPNDPKPAEVGTTAAELPSYNVIMTIGHMFLAPRSKEKFVLPVTTKGSDEDLDDWELSVNSLGFAGMLLVKSEEELGRVLRGGKVLAEDTKEKNGVETSRGVGQILSEVGLNRVLDH